MCVKCFFGQLEFVCVFCEGDVHEMMEVIRVQNTTCYALSPQIERMERVIGIRTHFSTWLI